MPGQVVQVDIPADYTVVQFRSGAILERAHELAHHLRDAIESDLGNAEVLIHVQP